MAICALCVLLKNTQDTLLSPCPSVVTLTTVGVQDRAVFFYIHPLRQGVFFPVSSRCWGKPTDQHHENPHSTEHMVRPGLPTHYRSVPPLPITPQPISRFLVPCPFQESYGSSQAAYPAPTAQLSLANSLQALPTSGWTGPQVLPPCMWAVEDAQG